VYRLIILCNPRTIQWTA